MSKPIMSLALSRDGSLSVISVAGELDMSNAHLLTELVGYLCQTPVPLIAVDLSAVRFFGAHGVSALLKANRLAAGAGGRLTLRDPSPFVRRVLGVAGVTRHLAIAEPSTPVGAPVTGAVPRLPHGAQESHRPLLAQT
ncbi:STAS domain-containing protein [Micromonospora sp. NPDC005189]|uniref:STAS domain-containing protein n=1 Tax=unclassified Micromonospora TaxID=2617518 RepID=UPI0033A79940